MVGLARQREGGAQGADGVEVGEETTVGRGRVAGRGDGRAGQGTEIVHVVVTAIQRFSGIQNA